MGVVYKLTPEVSSFIIAQKQSNPKVSCQLLAEMVSSRFNYQISKSSVHELLKQAQIITPRERKIKEKFQIPLEKKSQIFATLPPIVLEKPAESPKAVDLPELLGTAPALSPIVPA